MRRRQPAASGSLPANLAAFVSSDWEGRDEAERYGQWMVARAEWADTHSLDELPGDDEARANFPDGEFRIEDI